MKASQMVEMAKQEWLDSGCDSCFGGEITHEKIMLEDMQDALQELGNAAACNLSYNDILTFKNRYNNAVEDRIRQYADDCEFENELAKAGV